MKFWQRKMYNIDKIPTGWAKVKIGDLFDFIGGGTPSKKEFRYWNGDIPWASVKDIKGSYLNETQDKITKLGLENSAANIANPGDVILITRISPGKVITTKIKTAINQDLKIVRPKYNANPDFVRYLFNTLEKECIKLSSGTTVLGITLDVLNYINIIIPPLNEQHRIVDKLDELLSELEKGKEQLQTSLEQLKVYRQSILKHAFEGKLSEEWRRKQKKLKTPDELVAEIKAYRKQQYEKQLKEYKAGKIKVKPKEPKEIIPVSMAEMKVLPKLPLGWTYVKISSLGDTETGTTPSKAKPEYYGDKYPFYKPTELEAGFNVRKAKEYLSESGIKQARFLPENSILVTSIGATIGKTGIIRVAGASNQQINAIVPHEIFNPNFLYFQAVGQHFQDQIKSNAVATTLPILNKSKFEKLVFAICSIDEQNFIVDDIESKFSNTEKMEETIVQSIEVSNTLKQSLLQKAFEGKLVEQDPSDEPTSILLERIKKEREEYLKAEKERINTEKPPHIKAKKMAEELKRIIEILKESKEPVSAKILWQSSTHKDDIDDFYAALKKHIEAGEIIELPRKGKESFLTLADLK